jgi:glycosyltransferase 2 family protein
VKKFLKFSISLAITIGCFWWTFKDTLPGTPQWDALVSAVKSANYWMLLPYSAILMVIHVARTLRWGNLLSGIQKVPFRQLNEASGIGFMMLIVLPFRMGEFARPFLIAERTSIRRSAAMTSVVFERIVDGITVAVALRALLFFVPNEHGQIDPILFGANLMFAIFGGGLLFLLFARWQHDRAVRLIAATAGRISPKLGEKVAHIVDGFVGAMKQLPDAKNLTAFFLWTAVYWVLNGVGLSLLSQAFMCDGGAAGCVPMSLTSFQSFVVLGVLIGGVMIPAAPGGGGLFQASIMLGMGVFLPSTIVKTSGLAYANLLWIAQIGQQLLFGVILMAISRRSFSGIAGKLEENKLEAEQASNA